MPASASVRRPDGTGCSRIRSTGRGGVDAQFFALWQATPLADAYLGRLAASLVDSFALGQREATDFLGVSFSVLDDVGHAFGPESREVEDVLRQLDVTLGDAHRSTSTPSRARQLRRWRCRPTTASRRCRCRRSGGRIATEDVRERIEDALRTAWGPLEKGTVRRRGELHRRLLRDGVFDRLRANPTTDGVGDTSCRGDSRRVARAAHRSTVGEQPAIR